jgi:hypothetical protein
MLKNIELSDEELEIIFASLVFAVNFGKLVDSKQTIFNELKFKIRDVMSCNIKKSRSKQ